VVVDDKKHNKLNTKQLHLLTLIYKFRFISIPLLTKYQNLKSQTTLLRNLKILEEQGYIGRHFDLTFKINRKPAYYYLAAKGIATLKTDPRFDSGVLHSYYKNKNVSESFMQRSVDTLATFIALRETYADNFDMFSKPELATFEDFPENKPDLYLRGNTEYFVTLAHDVQPFLTRKRLAEYIVHSEETGWESGTYPTLLFILSDSINESRLLGHASSILESSGIDNDELIIGATTVRALTQKPYNASIWTFIHDTYPRSLT
jgi:DNA-binding MarR family transcriptional regulator